MGISKAPRCRTGRAGRRSKSFFETVRKLGNGEWLAGTYPGHGVYESADRWLGEFLSGRDVQTPEDAREARAGAEDAEMAEGLASSLDEYIGSLPARRAEALRRRLEDSSSRAMSLKALASISAALGAAYTVDDDDFATLRGHFDFLKPDVLRDAELRAMARHFIVENSEAVFEETSAAIQDGGRAKNRATRRAKALAATLAKATKASAS